MSDQSKVSETNPFITQKQFDSIIEKRRAYIDRKKEELDEISNTISENQEKYANLKLFRDNPDDENEITGCMDLNDPSLFDSIAFAKWFEEQESEYTKFGTSIVIEESRLKKISDALSENYNSEDKTYRVAKSDISQVNNILRSPSKGLRAQFVYKGESSKDGGPVSAADTFVLYWKFSKKNPDKLAAFNRGKKTANSDSHIMKSIGIAKTDSQGFIYASQMKGFFRDNNIGFLAYNPATESLKYELDHHDATEFKQYHANIANECELDMLRLHYPEQAVLGEFSDQFNTKRSDAEDGINLASQDYCVYSGDDISIEFFDQNTEYGFLLFPPELGDCDFAKLSTLHEILNEDSIPYVTKTKVEEGKPIELHCNLREWVSRISKITYKMDGENRIKAKIAQRYMYNNLKFGMMSEIVEKMEQFPFDSRPDDKSGEKLRDSISAISREITNFSYNMDQYADPECPPEKLSIEFRVNNDFEIHARELWELLQNPGFLTEWKHFLARQDFNSKSETVNKGGYSISYPTPPAYLTADYYGDFIYGLLSLSYTLLAKSNLQKIVHDDDIQQSMDAFTHMQAAPGESDVDDAIANALQLTSQGYLKKEEKASTDALEQNYASKKEYYQGAHSKFVTSTKKDDNGKYVTEASQFPPGKGPMGVMWQVINDTSALVKVSIVNSPGCPCLLQCALDSFGDHLFQKIVYDVDNFSSGLKILKKIAYFLKGSDGDAKALGQVIQQAIDNTKKNLKPANRLLGGWYKDNAKFKYSDIVYSSDIKKDSNGSAAISTRAASRTQVMGSVMLKSGLTVLSLVSIADRTSDLIYKAAFDDEYEIAADDIVQTLATIADSALAFVTATKVANNIRRLIRADMVINSGPRMAALTTFANKVAVGAQIISAIIATSKMFDALEEGRVKDALVQFAYAASGFIGAVYLLAGWIAGASMGTLAWISAIIAAGAMAYEIYTTYFRDNLLVQFEAIYDTITSDIHYKYFKQIAIDKFEKKHLIFNFNHAKDLTSFNDHLSWHAIIPLYNSQMPEEIIAKIVTPGDKWWLKEEVNRNKWKGAISTMKCKYHIQPIINFFKMVSNEDDAEKVIGSKTFRDIAVELITGKFLPEKQADYGDYDFFIDDFFSIPASATGEMGGIVSKWKADYEQAKLLEAVATNPHIMS